MKKESLLIAIATLITVIAWVVFDIIHAGAQIQTPPNLEELASPIEPNFDLSAVENE